VALPAENAITHDNMGSCIKSGTYVVYINIYFLSDGFISDDPEVVSTEDKELTLFAILLILDTVYCVIHYTFN